MPEYIVRAALAGEANNGWIWICGPSSTFTARTVVAIKRPGRCRAVYAEVRKIDSNFLQKYNADGRIHIDQTADTVVMAEWYRHSLAIAATTKSDDTTGRITLSIAEPYVPIWPPLRAACHHPDPAVRLGTRLGVLGVWLGLWGIWLGARGVWPTETSWLLAGFVVVVVLGVFGLCATWGPPRPRME